jgi:hypothetical protein
MFKFFSSPSTAGSSPRPPDVVMSSVLPDLPPLNPRGQAEQATASAESDALALFLAEEPARPPSYRPAAGGTVNVQRQAPAPANRGAAPTSRTPAIDDLRKLFRQTELELERSKSEANALRLDLSQLRADSVRLAHGYARLGDASHQTEKRNDLAAEAIIEIENRLGPLEVVRDLASRTDERMASLRHLAEEVTTRATDFQARKKAIDQGLEEVVLVTELLASLEARVATLIEKNELLNHAEATVGRLERQAAETTADLARNVDEFDRQKHSIEDALAEARRVTALLAALDERIATLSGDGDVLGHAAVIVGDLERRAAQTTGDLDRRVHEFGAQKQSIEKALDEATRASEIAAALDARVVTLAGDGEKLGHAAATIGNLERRADETTADLTRRLNEFDGQRQSIDEALDEATRVTAVLSALDARVATLTGDGEVLGHAAAIVGDLERRAAQKSGDLDRRVEQFDTQKQTIEKALDEATRASEIAAALDARVATLSGDGEKLGHAAATIGHLEWRAAEMIDALERRVNEFSAQKRTIESAVGDAARVTGVLAALDARVATLAEGEVLGHVHATVGQLEQRAAETTAGLERRVQEFEVQKHAIEKALIEATRVAAVVTAIDARVATLTGDDHLLGHAEATVGHLEWRAAEATADLERRVNEFDAQKRSIEEALANAAQVADIVGGLDSRVAALAGHDMGLGSAEATVGQLEQRAAAAALQFHQAARAKDELEDEVAKLQQQLQALTDSARNNVASLASYQQRGDIPHLLPVPTPRRAPEPRRSGGTPVRDAETGNPAVPRWPPPKGALALVSLLAVVVTLLGAPAMSWRNQTQTARIDPPVRPAQREAASSPEALPSRPLDVGSFTIPRIRPAAIVRTAIARTPAANARAAKERGQKPAVIARHAGSTKQTGELAKATLPTFLGALFVESDPSGAGVFVNQQRVGETPLQLTSLRAGSHVIRVERDGYERWTTAVLVPADRKTRVSATLQPARKH